MKNIKGWKNSKEYKEDGEELRTISLLHKKSRFTPKRLIYSHLSISRHQKVECWGIGQWPSSDYYHVFSSKAPETLASRHCSIT